MEQFLERSQKENHNPLISPDAARSTLEPSCKLGILDFLFDIFLNSNPHKANTNWGLYLGYLGVSFETLEIPAFESRIVTQHCCPGLQNPYLTASTAVFSQAEPHKIFKH
jgi:hypothetical protein